MANDPRLCGRKTLVAKTCVMCYEFKMASEFHTVYGKYHASTFKTCNHKLAKMTDLRLQAKSMEWAVNHRQPWSPIEIDELSMMYLGGWSHKEIAIYLKRSMASINQKILKEGLFELKKEEDS